MRDPGDRAFLFPAIRAKGNGFAMGVVSGPGVVLWQTFLRVQIGWRR